MNYLICKKCGWVHFGKSINDVIDELIRFRNYYETLSKKDQKEMYGGKCSSIADYMHCFRCNALYTEMRKAKKSELPFGSTIQPILMEEKKHGKQRLCRAKRKANTSI